MRTKRTLILLLSVAILFLVLVVIVAAGFLDFLAEDGCVNRREAIGCLAAY